MPSCTSNSVSNGFVLKYFTYWLSGFSVISVCVQTSVFTGSNPNTFHTSTLASSESLMNANTSAARSAFSPDATTAVPVPPPPIVLTASLSPNTGGAATATYRKGLSCT